MAEITGRITINNKDILEVDADPASGLGTPAPIGSLACFDSGTIGRLYIKVGAADTAWTQMDTQEGDDWNLDGNELSGATFDAPTEFFGSTNNFDVVFQRNNFELMRLVQEGLLVGLNATLGGRLDVGVANLGDVIMNMASPNGGSGARVIRTHRQFKITTSDDTNTVIAALAVAEGQRMQARAYVGCNQTGGTAGTPGDGADYVRTASAKRLSGGNVDLLQRTTDYTAEDVNAYRARFVGNTVGQTLDLEVRGATDRTCVWSAHIETMLFID